MNSEPNPQATRCSSGPAPGCVVPQGALQAVWPRGPEEGPEGSFSTEGHVRAMAISEMEQRLEPLTDRGVTG